jgi:tetratricopeptide (TPR) repeat protein
VENRFMMDSHRDEIAKLESLYASNPEGRVFTHLAEACRKAGQLERAREILEDGLRRHPDYASAHVVLGRVLSDSGDAGAAASEFRRVLELDRHNLVALRSLGDLARAENRADEALYYYGELAVLDPTDGGIQEEIRRLRVQLAEGPPAPPAGAMPIEPAQPVAEAEPPAEVASGATPLADAPPAEVVTTDSYFEGTGADTPSAAGEARPEGWSASHPEPAPPELLSVPSELVMDLPRGEEPEERAAVGGDLAGLTLTPAPGAAPPAETSAGQPEPPEMAAEEAGAPEAYEAREAAASKDEPAAEQVAEPVKPDWSDTGAVWPKGPPNADAERRAELGDSGEWIPAERWEWMAASAGAEGSETADVTESEAEAEQAEDGDEWPDVSMEAELEPQAPSWMAADLAWQEQPRAEPEAYESEPASLEGFEVESVVEFTASFESTEYLSMAPTPEMAEPGAGEYEAGDDDDEGDLVITETLAEIYATQGLFERAAAVYRRLLQQRPGDERLRARLNELETSGGWPAAEREREASDLVLDQAGGGENWLQRVESAWTGGEGAVSAEESPYAWPTESSSEEAGRQVGDYFRSLLSWRPGSGVQAGMGVATGPSTSEPPLGTVDADPATSFDAWFSRETALPAETGESGRSGTGGEGDEDLEMFRSWLKSLKK